MMIQETEDGASPSGTQTSASGNTSDMGGHASHVTARSSSESDTTSSPDSDQVYMELGQATDARIHTVSNVDREDLEYNIPILGYEVMEERARFTVFRIQVEHRETGRSWYVFRRYTDFTRLNRKLKSMFPGLRFSLPPKRWFGDNFDSVFLEDRLLGLQAFVNNIISHQDIGSSPPVKEFFCLDDPPGHHDTIEESMAFCETLEKTVERMTQAVKVRDTSIQLLRTEVAMLQSQQDALLKSLKLECSLMAQMQEHFPKVCMCQKTQKNLNSIESNLENAGRCSCRSQILRLHQLNMELVNMVEKSVTDSNSGKLLGSEANTGTYLDQELQEGTYVGESRRAAFGGNCSCPSEALPCFEHGESPAEGERPSPLGGSGASSPVSREGLVSETHDGFRTAADPAEDGEKCPRLVERPD